jgi:hypothetical protein
MSESRLVTFKFVSSTKNTHKYDEQVSEGEEPVIKTLYIQKSAMETPKRTVKLKIAL